MDKWDCSDWLYDARTLLNWKMLSGDNPIMLVIRHSYREDPSNASDVSKLRLTETGRRGAISFGERLPRKDSVELYYSVRHRCMETAEKIAEGYNSTKSGAVFIGDVRALLGPMGKGEKIANEMMAQGGPEFIIRWIENRVPLDTIEPLADFGSVFRNTVLRRLVTAARGTLLVCVTHDLVLMGVRNILFGTIPSSKNWSPYLGGFGIAKRRNKLVGYEMGKEIALNPLL